MNQPEQLREERSDGGNNARELWRVEPFLATVHQQHFFDLLQEFASEILLLFIWEKIHQNENLSAKNLNVSIFGVKIIVKVPVASTYR